MDASSLLAGALAGVGLTAVVTRGREDRAVALGLADVLQWGFLVAGPEAAVVLNKDGALLTAWRYAGPDVATASGAELDAIARQANDALLPFADGWMWHVDEVRRPAEPYPASAFAAPYADARDISVPAWIDAERRAAFGATLGTVAIGGAASGAASDADRGAPDRRAVPRATPDRRTANGQRPAARQFVSEYTLTLTYLPPPDTHARAAEWFVSGRPAGHATGAPGAADVWQATLARFEEYAATIEQRLSGRFRLERLDAAALVSHLHRCLTALSSPVTPPPIGAYLNHVLASQEFVPGFVPRIGRQHVHVIAVEGYPEEQYGARLDFLNRLSVPHRWSSRFIPLGQRTADKLIKRHRQSWFSKRKDFGTFVKDLTSNKERSGYEQQREDELFGNGDATSMLRDLNAAAALNASGTVRYGFSTQVVVVADEDPATSSAYAAEVVQALHDHGFTARVETVNAPEAFFGSLPGHGYQNIRRQPLHSKNLADLWPLTSVWPGLATNPSQFFAPGSPALMHVATDGSTPFRFNLHVGDVGSALVVGDPGKGKSVFLGLIQAQWQRYPGARTTVFDYDYSHWVLAKACGARHYDLCSGRPDAVALAPLADVDQPHERAWAASWIEVLLELQGVHVTPAQRALLGRALALLGKQERRHRRLSELVVQLQDPDLRTALQPYLETGTYGQLFDAADEAVGNEPYQVFELKHLLALGDKVAGPAFLYLMHRGERRLDGRPDLLIAEEMHALLRAGVFSALLDAALLTRRKQNGAVVMTFHTVGQIAALPSRGVVIGSTQTRILLPSAEASTEENAPGYRALGLSDAEIALVASGVPKRDYYVRSPLGGRVVRLDLGPVARAFLGTPPGLSPEAARQEVTALEARDGGAWPLAWLARAGVEPPVDAVIAPAATASTASPASAAVADKDAHAAPPPSNGDARAGASLGAAPGVGPDHPTMPRPRARSDRFGAESGDPQQEDLAHAAALAGALESVV